jgi:alkaline phosphatase D
MTALTRRTFLRGSAALTGMAAFGMIPGPRALAATGPVFSLGVASGDPSPNGVVLWTRLVRDPLDLGGLTNDPVTVAWEVAKDEAFATVVRHGKATAFPDDGHNLHVQVKGLDPDRWYWYRFHAFGESSRIGRTRTMPARGVLPDRLRFALVSCQDYQNGNWAAYRDIAEQDLDLVFHVGDYIYEYAANPNGARQHLGGETQTLEDYRRRYAQYRLDPLLQEAHASFPFVVTWDDHEVQDNYTGDVSNVGIPRDQFLARRAAAYQAYFEAMPLRRSARPRRTGMTLYRSFDFGRLARFAVLDGRQFRTDQPCNGDGLGIVPECPEVFDQSQTFLGQRQESWLYRTLRSSKTRWNVLAQQVMMLRGDLGEALNSPNPIYNVDAWDGYQAQRKRLLDFLAREEPSNPIVLTGDIHSAWAADLKQDFLVPGSKTVASEFVCTSISTAFIDAFIPLIEANLGPNSRNPHIKFFEGRHRGWTRCEVTPDLWRSDFRIVDSLLDPASPVTTAASWVVEDGVPGTRPA